mgnify:CR=1 FL=1
MEASIKKLAQDEQEVKGRCRAIAIILDLEYHDLFEAKIEEPKPTAIKPNKSWTDSRDAKEWNEDIAHPNGYKEAWE